MKKISLFAIVGALVALAANAATDTTVVAVDEINGDVPAPQMEEVGYMETTTVVTPAPTSASVTSPAAVNIVTVKDAKNLPDNTQLVLRGNIIKSLGDEKYTFQDPTDTITVEIEDDNWNGLVVAPTDTVLIYGEVDSGLFRTEIDVDRIEIVR